MFPVLLSLGACCSMPCESPRRIGVIGLGSGTLAACGRPGDQIVFYEINPLVVETARNHFSYLRDSRATCEVRLGDARIQLENEPPNNFDILVLDVCSSDSIPAHLLTREAFAVYHAHLKPEGALLVHITNRYLDLFPLVYRLGEETGDSVLKIRTEAQPLQAAFAVEWVVLARNADFTAGLCDAVKRANRDCPPTILTEPPEERKRINVRTDNFNSLVDLLK